MSPPPVLRVCLAAENASVRMGGEAILPYHYFRLFLSRAVDVHLVVHERCRAELLALFPEHAERLHFVRDRLLQKLLFRLGALLPRRISEATFGLATQLITQQSQRRVLRKLATKRSVAHQPIPVAPRFPSLLSDLGMPLVVGPLNGGMEFPPAFQRFETSSSRTLIALARALTNAANALCQGKRDAAIVLFANQRTRAALPRELRGRTVEMPENAVDPRLWQTHQPAAQAPSSKAARRFLFIGRLVDWKALDIVLDAMAVATDCELDVVGDGPMRQAWQTHARHADGGRLAPRVRFHGWQPQTACADLLRAATALVLPSLYESGGAVVLEAMAAARPVIATAWGGPTDYLDATCGILLDPTSRPALVSAFATAMQRLAASPDLCTQLGAAGQAKVLATYDWERKADQMLALYSSLFSSE